MTPKGPFATIERILSYACVLSVFVYLATLMLSMFGFLPIRSRVPNIAIIIAASIGVLYLLVRTYRLERSKPQDIKEAERRPRQIERLYMITIILSLLAALARINGYLILVGSGAALIFLTRLGVGHFAQMFITAGRPIPSLVWAFGAIPALIVFIFIALFVGSFRLF
jgi:hypothetical protein